MEIRSPTTGRTRAPRHLLHEETVRQCRSQSPPQARARRRGELRAELPGVAAAHDVTSPGRPRLQRQRAYPAMLSGEPDRHGPHQHPAVRPGPRTGWMDLVHATGTASQASPTPTPLSLTSRTEPPQSQSPPDRCPPPAAAAIRRHHRPALTRRSRDRKSQLL